MQDSNIIDIFRAADPCSAKTNPDIVAKAPALDAAGYLDFYRHGYYVREMNGRQGYEIYDPAQREIIDPTASLIPPDTLGHGFEFSIDQNFGDIVLACSRPHIARENRWMGEGIIHILTELHERGLAHSIGIHQTGSRDIVGGLVGFVQGAAFFGVSCFQEMYGANQAALNAVKLILRKNKFLLFDCVQRNSLVRGFGSKSVSKEEYLALRSSALEEDADFLPNRGRFLLHIPQRNAGPNGEQKPQQGGVYNPKLGMGSF